MFLGACSSNPSRSASSNNSTTAESAQLTVGTEGTYPPFSFRDLKTGELAGYDIDVATEVAKRLNTKIEFVPTQYKSMLVSLDTKRFDFVANQVSVTPERKKQFTYGHFSQII